jgi:hypothetical protein
VANFKPAKGLNALAAQLVAGEVSRIAGEIRDSAQEKAPPSKRWKSQEDALVRDSHRHANGQEVPDNVRFQVKTPSYDQQHYDPHEYQMMKFPGDRENATPGNYEWCRCESIPDPEGVKRNIESSEAVAKSTKASAHVTAKFNRIEESEYGANGEAGIRFMGRALTEVAAKQRGR